MKKPKRSPDGAFRISHAAPRRQRGTHSHDETIFGTPRKWYAGNPAAFSHFYAAGKFPARFRFIKGFLYLSDGVSNAFAFQQNPKETRRAPLPLPFRANLKRNGPRPGVRPGDPYDPRRSRPRQNWKSRLTREKTAPAPGIFGKPPYKPGG